MEQLQEVASEIAKTVEKPKPLKEINKKDE